MGGGSPAARFTDGSPDARRRGAAARQDVSSPSYRARVGPGSYRRARTHTRKNVTYTHNTHTRTRTHIHVRARISACEHPRAIPVYSGASRARL